MLKHRYMSTDEGDGLPPPVDSVDVPPVEPEVKPFYESMPEDWRNQMVDSFEGWDQETKDKRLGQLNRFSDIKSMGQSFFDANDKIRSGQIETGLPENATEEQLNEYREANGIPDSAEGYAESLDEGLVLGEVDNRIMEDVYKVAHDNNVSSETVNQLTSAMMSARQREQDAMIAKDGLDKQQSERVMRETWGGDYEANINMVAGLVGKLPEGVRANFENARMGDGQALFNSPEMLSFLTDAARLANPAGTVVPNSNNPTQAIGDEIKTLEAKMGTDDWFKDTASQKRYRDLLDAQERMQS